MTLEHEFIKKEGPLPFHTFTFRAKDTKRIIPQHWHQSTELLYCIEGNLSVLINQKSYLLKSGDIIVINPNTVHSTHSPTHNHVLCLQLQYSFLSDLTNHQFNHEFLFSLNTAIRPCNSVLYIREQLLKLVHYVENPKEDSVNGLADSIEEESIVFKIISNLIRYNSCKIKNQNNNSVLPPLELMNDLTNYINAHFKDRITLHGLAKHFGYSDSYLSRIFASNFGMNFHDFLNSVRMNEAVSKLNNPNYTIDRIATECGFSTYRNFYNTFIGIYQITPTKYRDSYL
jgi:AraC-like DNA-binding protein